MDFEDFLGREWDGLFRYARVLTRDRHQAEDLLADALLKVQRHWRRVVEADSPLAYVRRIVTTTAISRRRSWASRHVRTTRSGALPEVPVAVDGFARIEQREQVAELLARLPARQRAAVALRYLLDRTDAEIAAEMGCSASAVRGYISRALAALRTDRSFESAGEGTGGRAGESTGERAVDGGDG